MFELTFWKTWPKDYKWLFFILSTVFLFSLALTWVYYFQGADAVIDWQRIQEQKTIETSVHNFRVGPFQLSVPAESYVILEYLAGSFVHHNFTATYAFLIVLAFCAAAMLSIITTLDRFWYFGGMSLFIIFLISLRFDVLRLFGSYNIVVPIAIVALYVIASFYFKYFRSVTPFIIRLLVFLGITVVLGITIGAFSQVSSPFINLLITSYTPAVILTILFILLVAHEILVSFVYIATQAKGGNAAKHFSIISAIYLVNVIVTCLHELGVVNWDFVYINLFLLLTVSALLGLWGFRLRETLYGNIINFSPFGAFFYLAFASIAFITIAQLAGNANDPAIKIIRYTIIFSHAGYGIIFFVYFLSNFMAMMTQNINVYGLIYKPNRMPYFTFGFAGLIATLAFLFYSNWRDFVYNGIGGFYNYVGDMYILEGDEAFAQSFYEQSRNRAFQNNRANYALAIMKTARMNFEGARYNYELANAKRPTEYSLVNAGNLNFWTARYFDAIKAYRSAQTVLPNSPVLANNLGYTYTKVHAVDSAGYFLNNARDNKRTRESAETNFFALAAAEYLPINTDSVLKVFNTQSPAVMSNAVACATLFNQNLTIDKDPLAQRELDLYSATFLNNHIIHYAKTLDTTFLSKAHVLSSDSVNLPYREALWASLAHAYYHKGKVFRALAILGELGYITQSYQGTFNYIMGLWALEQGNPQLASTSFSFAQTADFKNARFYNAIALTEARKINEAIIAWDTVSNGEDASAKRLATQIKNILQVSPANVLSLSDGEKYQFCRYRLGLRDTTFFNRIVESFTDANYKGQALLEMAERNYDADRIIPAIQYLNRISGLQLTDKRLYEDIQHFELLLLASRKEVRQLAQQINKENVHFDQKRQLEKMLYTALVSESSGDTTKARMNYEVLATSNPYFEEGILAAVDFFRRQDAKSTKAYDILVESLYVNEHSIRLLKAYAAEASRQGLDEYASSAVQRLMAQEANL